MNSAIHALIIDDNSESRTCLKKMLSRFGCDVDEVSTAEQGIELLLHSSFAMVIASLCVRSMGGRSVARWVKNNRPKTKFFILTSWQGELEPAILASDGIYGVIHKPFHFNEIRDVLGEPPVQ
ncbi:MAG: response regulator [Chitinivibrionales bacterium]|nr:response regulator [Chitinivibrionales bacterium]